MVHSRSVALAGFAAVVVLALSGCFSDQPIPEPTNKLESCALGHTWQLDFNDLAPQVLAHMQATGVPATGVVIDGQRTLSWGVQGNVTLTSNFTVTATAAQPDQTITVVETHSGITTGDAYINGEVAIPRRWDSSQESIQVAATSNGAALEPAPWKIPSTLIDDVVGLEITCGGEPESLSIHPRAAKITQRWTRVS